MNRLHVATAGLFAAWLAHDIEELATMSGNSRALVRRLPDWVPLPASVRQRGLTQRYLATGVSAVGLVVAAASVRGYRTRGRSAFYQNTGPRLRPARARPHRHQPSRTRLHEWCRHSSYGRRPLLAVGNPDATASRRWRPTQPSGRDRTLRRIPRRRPSRRLHRHQEPALNRGRHRMITNVHERVLNAPPTEIGTLTDGLVSDGDRLWPGDCWPPMRLDRPRATCAATAVATTQMRRNRPSA